MEANLREFFASLDRDGNGRIAVYELAGAIELHGFEVDNSKINDILRAADSDGNGTIDCDEFVRMMRQAIKPRSEKLLEAVKAFDRDGNGFISRDEIVQALKNSGGNMSEEALDATIKRADKNGDGQIDYQEFVKML